MRVSTVADGVKALLRQKVSVPSVPWWVDAVVLGVSWGIFALAAIASIGSALLTCWLGISFDYGLWAVLAFGCAAAAASLVMTASLSIRVWTTTPPKECRRRLVTTPLAALVSSGAMVLASSLSLVLREGIA